MGGFALAMCALLAVQASENRSQPAPAAEARPAPARPGLSWEEADVVARTLRRIDRRLRSGRPASKETIVVTERQLNSFVNLSLGDRIPSEVTDLELRLEPGRLAAHATVDLDQLRSKMPEGTAATALLALLSGPVPVELRGRVAGADGMGQLTLEEARVGGVGMPPSVLAQLVALATRTEEQPKGVDIGAPQPLPWTARRLRVESGRLLVDFQ